MVKRQVSVKFCESCVPHTIWAPNIMSFEIKDILFASSSNVPVETI